MQGHRKKKLEARKIRLQEEEEQKKKVDIEHKKFVAQMRKEAIEKAKLQQYYQTDRVKNFHVNTIQQSLELRAASVNESFVCYRARCF